LITIYTIDNITIENLIASYYKDKLVYAKCDPSSELHDAIKAKYGPDDQFAGQPGVDYYFYWNNGNIKSGYSSYSPRFEVEINGGYKFLSGANSRDYIKAK
jgi:hypothetical protein